jgi:hypothetical protein
MRRQYKYLIIYPLFATFFFTVAAQDLDTASPILTQDTTYRSNVSSSENYQFKELTTATSVPIRKAGDKEVQKLKSDEDYWYVNQVPQRNKDSTRSGPAVNEKGPKEPEDETGGIFNSKVLNLVFWVLLVGGFITLLTWFLTSSNIRLIRSKKPTNDEEEPEDSTEDIFQMDFEKEIQQAIDNKQFTLAVRLMYLQTLRELSDKHLINYSGEKTNGEYLFQLAGTTYYKRFFRLTRSFDYTWYGQFQLSQDSFGTIQNDFVAFKQELPK